MAKRYACLISGILACAVLLYAAATGTQPATSNQDGEASNTNPGVELAQTLSAMTGVAISPLLGVGGIGAWKYFTTPEGRRGELPWYTSPLFWIPALLIVVLLASKEIVLAAFPVAKKPMDALEVFESKISAVVATPAIVPMVIKTVDDFALTVSVDSASAGMTDAGIHAINMAPSGAELVLYAVCIALSLLAFFVIWLAGHTINLLILISPFSLIDAFLKGIRYALLAIVVGSALIHPYFGAVVALGILVVAFLVAKWAFRLTVFGTFFAWDLLTLHHRRFRPDDPPVAGFTSRRFRRVPRRTYGRLSRDQEGSLAFSYRPWLIGRTRILDLPAKSYSIGRGLVSPSVMCVDEQNRRLSLIALPPRYRTHEQAVAAALGIGEVRDTGIRKGLRAAAEWLREAVGRARTPGEHEAAPC